MSTVINNPPSVAGADSSGAGGLSFLIGVIILILFVLFLFMYLLPMLRSSMTANSPQLNVPEKVEVDVQVPQAQ